MIEIIKHDKMYSYVSVYIDVYMYTGNRKRTLDRKGPVGKWVEPGK